MFQILHASTQFRFVNSLKLIFNSFPLPISNAQKFSLAKMTSATQNPTETQTEFLLVCGWLATVSLEP